MSSMQFLAVCLFATTLFGFASIETAQAAIPAASPPSSGPFPFVTCPTYATQYCDFTLQYSKYHIPNFPIKEYKADTVLSSALWNSKLNQPVISASTAGSCFFVPEGKTKTSPKCGSQFYFGNPNGHYRRSNKITVRALAPNVLPGYVNKCIVMPINSAKLRTARAMKRGKAKFIFINSKDGNKDYPEDRRCVVFTTNS